MSTRALDTNGAGLNSLSRYMATGLADVQFGDLSPETVNKAKLCLLDYLASAFASHDLPWARQARHMAAGTPGDSTIVGVGTTAARGEAAFANAVLGHGLVRDDMHLGSVSHLGVVVIPPALAVAESAHCSGPDLLAAIVAGYEAGGRLGRAILDVDVARIFRPTGITGPVAGVVAAGRLTGLNAAELANAIGLAANTVLGYNEWAATGGSEMFFHPGFAVRNALTAADLAAAGACVSPSALEGPAGLLAAFGKGRNAAMLRLFENMPEILAVFFKEVPACNFAQTSAQAARAVAIGNDIQPAAIDSVTVRVPQAAAAYPGCDAPGPFTHVLQAKMSIHYNVAAALLRRNFDETNYEPAGNPDITALAQRIVLEVDPALTAHFPAQQGAGVTVHLAGGKSCAHSQEDVAAADEDLVNVRFDAAASARLGREQALKLREAITFLDKQADAAAVVGLCRAKAETAHRARE